MSAPTASDPLPITESTASAVPEVPVGIGAPPNASAGRVENVYGAGDAVADGAPHDLKRRTARGALVSMFGQVATFILRIGSMVVLARLLDPHDFGVVGMVTACTGFLGLFRDAGLSMATIQRVSVSRAQISTLFWINVLVGVILSVLCAAMAPILTHFYNEPRLLWVTIVIGGGFLFNGATAQHRAILQRNMRFAVLTLVDILALIFSLAVGVAMAMTGFGYWALVGMTVALPAASLVGVWVASGWIPGPPERRTGVRSMLRYGGTVTLNNLIVYIAYNADKVLLGRYWGAATLGIYGRAYQLVSMPNDSLSSTIALVAFPALSRLQNDPPRLKSYFLKGYGLFLSLVVPITMGCALFAEDIIRVFLGPKWGEATPVFRLLAPTILTFALINPFGWFLLATGGHGAEPENSTDDRPSGDLRLCGRSRLWANRSCHRFLDRDRTVDFASHLLGDPRDGHYCPRRVQRSHAPVPLDPGGRLGGSSLLGFSSIVESAAAAAVHRKHRLVRCLFSDALVCDGSKVDLPHGSKGNRSLAVGKKKHQERSAQFVKRSEVAGGFHESLTCPRSLA